MKHRYEKPVALRSCTRLLGFSLVELSIVLVILGLLVGGVLSGQSLIRASELRSVTQQYQSIIAATASFRDKYFAIPGNMNNASQFWGLQASYGSCNNAASSSALTCNGNGNGKVELSVVSNPYDSMEAFRFWQHLSNAGLIEGSYTGTGSGVSGIGGNTSNLRSGKLSNSLWAIYLYNGMVSGAANMFDGDYGNNSLMLAAPQGASSYPQGVMLLPAEIWNIDTKMDDGMPATGKLVAYGAFTICTTAVSGSDLTAIYQLASTSAACAPVFRQAF